MPRRSVEPTLRKQGGGGGLGSHSSLVRRGTLVVTVVVEREKLENLTAWVSFLLGILLQEQSTNLHGGRWDMGHNNQQKVVLYSTVTGVDLCQTIRDGTYSNSYSLNSWKAAWGGLEPSEFTHCRRERMLRQDIDRENK